MAKKILRCGFTTGSCVAAGVKAALLHYQGRQCAAVELRLPQGESVTIPIEKLECTEQGARAVIIKDSGDDPDITNGIAIVVEVKLDLTSTAITIKAGAGVGTVTKAGLAVLVGEPAINKVPRQMILAAAAEVIGAKQGCIVTITIPRGAELAKRTLNPSLGIVGGLSIIGTTGIVRPMSEEAFKHSLVPQINVAQAAGYSTLVFVPGKIGENVATLQYGLPSAAIVQTSNFIGYMLEQAAAAKIKRIMLFGHLGKLVKVAGGVFHTHNRVADGRLETLAAYAASAGLPAVGVREILACITTEAAMKVISSYHQEAVYANLAARASVRARQYVFEDLAVGTVLITLKGEILGMDETAQKIGEDLGWNIK